MEGERDYLRRDATFWLTKALMHPSRCNQTRQRVTGIEGSYPKSEAVILDSTPLFGFCDVIDGEETLILLTVRKQVYIAAGAHSSRNTSQVR